MTRTDDKRLDDMREMCVHVAEIAHRGREAFEGDYLLQLALERALEVIGEAANHVSQKTRGAFPTVPWTDITRLRIRLAHHYHRTIPERLWVIATDEIPPLLASLGPLVEKADGNGTED